MDRCSTPATSTATGSATCWPATPRGQLWLYAGNGTGALAPAEAARQRLASVTGLAAVGDVTGDGNPDLIGTPASGQVLGLGRQRPGFSAAAPVKGRCRRRPACRPTSRLRLGARGPGRELKGNADYIVRDRQSGVAFLYRRSQSGVSAPRLLGEGMGAFDLAG